MKKIITILMMLFTVCLLPVYAQEDIVEESHLEENANSKQVGSYSIQTDCDAEIQEMDWSQETRYRETIGVILNERESIEQIYTGFSVNSESEVCHFRFTGLEEDNPQVMLFHLLDVDEKMTEQILYTREGNDIVFEAKPQSIFILAKVNEREEEIAPVMKMAKTASNRTNKEFGYTGSVQEFTAPISTTYKLEVWGASGGQDRQHEAAGGRIMDGGRGGYSAGEIHLEKGQKIYIAVGGAGQSFAFNNSGGGFNGGGDAGGDLSSGGGGGATHIALSNYGELQNYSSRSSDVLIVAGGGGGGGYFSTGGHGGGLTANDDSSGRAKGGGAGFGAGQSRKTTDDGAGAGGGWRGGRVYVDQNDYGAGGGTGFIDHVQNGSSQIGVQSGNGKAIISWVNEFPLTIEYLEEGTDKKVAESHSVTHKPKETYSVTSPTIDNYLLCDLSQSVLTGEMNEEVAIKVYYRKPSRPTKTVFVNGESANGKYIESGQELTYTIMVHNEMNRDLDYVVKDQIPEHTTFISADQNGVQTDENVTWKLSIPAGKKETVSFKVKVNQSATIISNTAQIEVEHVTVESNVVENYIPEKPVKQVRNNQGQDLNKQIIQGQELLEYQVRIQNIASEEKQFTVIDQISEALEIVEIKDGGVYQDGKITWQVNMNAKSEKTVSFLAKPKENTKGTISNQVTQTVDFINTHSNQTDVSIYEPSIKTVMNQDGVSIDQHLVQKGAVVKYGILVHNPSPHTKSFTVSDTVPQDLEILTIHNQGEIHDGRIIWQVEVGPNSSRELSFEAKLLKENTHYTNQAEIQVDQIQTNTNMVEVWVPNSPTKTVFDEQGQPNEQSLLYAGEARQLTYEITVYNNSSCAKDFTITDKLIAALEYVKSSDGGTFQNQTVTWKVTVPAGDYKTVQLMVKPKDDYVGEKLTNTAYITVDSYYASTNTVTNYFDDKPEKVEVKGIVTWDDQDNKDKIRPGAVTVRLYANGTEVRNQKVIFDANGEMNFLFDAVSKYRKGKEVEYTVSEDDISGYQTTIQSQSHNVYEIHNKHTPGVKIEKVVTKPTPTPSTKYTGGVTAPKTGDSFTPLFPSSIMMLGILMGIFAGTSLRKWK